MKPFQQILVPTDFSTIAHNALAIAADVSRRYEAPITLLHVWEPELFSIPSSQQLLDPEAQTRLIAHFTKLLETERHTLTAAGAERVEIAVAEGPTVRGIVEYARRGAFDLIVMGTHGRTGFSHAMLGSVAERVVRTAACTVLISRPSEATVPASTDQRTET